jgi:gas vesicle protein
MTKTLLCSVAAIAFTLAAPSAFAQDADMDVKAKPKAEQMMDATEKAAEDAVDATEEAAEDAMDAVDDTTDEMMDATDDMMDDAADEMDDAADDVEDMMDDDADVDVTVTPDSTVVVDCPAGTEEQADGSCMVTGDWEPEE